MYKADPVTGHYHFKLPSGREFAMRKPKLSDLKRAAELSGSTTENATRDNLAMNEHLSMLLLTSVDKKPTSYEAILVSGGIEGIFDDLNDCLEVMDTAGKLKGGGKAVPLEVKS